ncbi:MAG: hypothetical protein VKO39_04330 [Cyanobacteriota bacterium]|nr:hypothetical protein [Cyanobacteriota bacterium]
MPDPLTALMTKSLLDSQPAMLDAYLDLELMSEMTGGASDTAYLQRITKAAGDPQRLLESWWQPHKQLQADQQDKARQLARLRSELEAKTAKMAVLEASLTQTASERDAARSERDTLQQGKAASLEAAAALTQQLADQAEALRRAREAETFQCGRADGLESDIQQARQQMELQGLELDQFRRRLARLGAIDQKKTAQLVRLRGEIAAQAAKVGELEASLAQVASERDAAERARDALQQDNAAALDAAAALTQQLADQTEALRRAREAETERQGTMEELEKEARQAREDAESLLLQLHQAQEELERLFLADHTHTRHIGELQNTLETHISRISFLEAELDRIASERDGAFLERDRIASERDGAFLERDRIASERDGAFLERDRIASERDGAFLERDRSASERDGAFLERDRSASERDRALRERDGLALEKATALATIATLNSDLVELREALRVARDAEAQWQARTKALEADKGHAQEEARRMLLQVHHLQEELEKSFLQGQAGEQLIGAQNAQLLRAQALMSRLLVQATRSLLPTQAISVEVIPARAANALSGSLPNQRDLQP